MRIALFSDLHAHPFQAYAKVLPNGLNSRLASAISCIEQVVEKCKALNIDLVLFGGDLFHVRRNINVVAYNAVYAAIRRFAENDIPLVMIHGNHDQADRWGVHHSLYAFTEICDVFVEPCWFIAQGKAGDEVAILGLPYTENVEHLRELVKEDCPRPELPKIMLGHFGIQGAKVGADFVYINPHDPAIEDLNCEAFDAVYLGHYHMHQQIADNAWYIGAPMQHNWGDAGQDRGFLVYDTDTKLHEFVSLSFPHFAKFDDVNKITSKPGDFVRVVDSEAWTTAAVNSLKDSINAQSLEIIPPKCIEQETLHRVEVTPNTGFHEAMEKYVESGVQPADGLDKNYLMQLGMEILEEIDGET